MRTVAEQHAIGRGQCQHVTTAFFPGEMARTRHQLLRLHGGELGKGAVRRLIAPDALRGREHGIAAVALFVVAIGLVAITSSKFTFVPIALGLCGAGLLLYAAFLLIKESRFALAAVNEEMDFMWKRGKEYGPPDLVKQGIKKARWFGGVK